MIEKKREAKRLKRVKELKSRKRILEKVMN